LVAINYGVNFLMAMVVWCDHCEFTWAFG